MSAAGDSVTDGTCPVIVAARVRPFNEMEKANYHESTLTVLPRDSSILVQNRPGAFEFDYVYGMESTQEDVYNSAIKDLVENTFDGYNATVCAYGQTGSGKTHTMGTAVNYSSADVDNTRGIVPRAAEHFFAGIEERKRRALEQNLLEPDFDISVQFIEIYNENFIDLFCSRDSRKKITVYYDKTVSSILVKGVNIRKIKNPAEMLEALKDGSVNRSVAATKMNSDSSRSHAIFTVYIRQKRQIPPESPDAPTDFEILNAKFHFVDLAGSERMDKTGATGTHALEGININSGLLQLGNVVNALVSGSKFVPYRNSKLTLMLQDSLGGNSRTAVIVCVSPSDFNFAETLQTLNFGLRLRNITTKVTANQDPQSAIINELKNKVKQLQTENEQLKNGKRTVNADGEIVQSDLYRENLELIDQINQHKTRIKALESVVESANARNISLQRQALVGHVPEGEAMKEATEGDTVSALAVQMLEDNEKLHSQIHEYQVTIDDLNKQVNHYRRMMIDMERDQDMSVSYNQHNGSLTSPTETPDNDFLEQAMQNVELLKAEAARIRNMHGVSKKKTSSDEEGFDDEDEAEPMDTGEDGDGDTEMAGESDAAEDEEDAEQDHEFEENKKVAYEISQDLANLNQDIVFKEKLINEIRVQRAEMDKIRASYELKVKSLQDKIEQTVLERDRQLADLQKAQARPGGNTAENKKAIEKVTKEYESKMAKLVTEQNHFKKMEKSHEKLKRTVAQKDKIIESREKEMRDLKANKVDLVKQLKAVQASRVQFERAAAKRERQQALENQKYKNKIQLLERKGDLREKMLARTRDEMNRKSKDFEMKQKLKAIANGPINKTPKKSAIFSPDRVHKIFKTLTAGVVSTARRRQLYDVYNEELTNLIEERRALAQKKAKLESAFLNTQTNETIDRLQAEIDGINEKSSYIESRQTYLQKLIIGEADEYNVKNDAPNEAEMEKLVQSCRSTEEYKYILSNLVNFTIERIANMSQSENELKREVQALSQAVEDMKGMHMTLNEDEINDILEMTKTASPQGENVNPAAKTKLRRRTSTPNDLLYGGPSAEPLKTSASNLTPVPEDSLESREILKDYNVGAGAMVPSDDVEMEIDNNPTYTISAASSQPSSSGTVSMPSQPSSSMETQTSAKTTVGTDKYMKMEGHIKSGVTTMSTCGDILMSGGRDHYIRAWDLNTHTNHWSVDAHAYTVNHVALASDERIVASAAAFSTRIYDIRDSQECLKIVQSSGLVEEAYVEKKLKKNETPKSETAVESLAWDPDGVILYIATRNYLKVWDLRFLRSLGSFQTPVSTRIQHLKVLPYKDDNHVRVMINHKMRDEDDHGYLYSYIGHLGSFEFSSSAIRVENGLTNFAATDRHAFVCTTDGKMNRYSLIDSTREAQVWSPDGSNFTLVDQGTFNGDPMVFTATESGVINTWEYGGQQSMILKDTHQLNTEVKCMAANSKHGTLYAGTGLREIVKII